MVRAFNIILCCIIAVFIVSSIFIFKLIYDRQIDLASVSRYNVEWSASQGATEITRLEYEIAAAIINPNPDAVQLRYSIILNRLEVLKGGDFKNFVDHVPGNRIVVDALNTILPNLAPLIDNLGLNADSDRLALEQALSQIVPLTPQFLALAASANRFGAAMVSADQDALLTLHWQFSALVAGLVLCTAALIVLLLRRNGMLTRAHGALRKLADELRATTVSRSLLDAALSNMSQGLCMSDADQRLIVYNRNFTSLLQLPTQLPAQACHFDALLALDPAPSTARADVNTLLWAQRDLVAGKVPASIDEELPDGRVIAITHQPTDDGGWVATYEDVTERRRAQDRIAFMAKHDALTGLPNRLLFRDELEKALARNRRHHESFAVHCLDLDHFKQVNDTLGHPIGDELLELVADRLRSCVREVDLVARLGGDEFAVIQSNPSQSEGAGELAQRVIEVLSAPFDIKGHAIVIGASVGIAIAPQDAADADSLMQNADLALYAAKTNERGTFRFFEAGMDSRAQERRVMEMELRRALAEGEFEIYYQPLVNVVQNVICGFEALLRWRHPEKGILAPALFIPLAEEIGLITNMGEWVLRNACAEAVNWPDGIKVAINLSVAQFRAPRRLVSAVRDALQSSGLNARRLELEITETVFLHEGEATLTVLHQIRDMGVRIAMDDFGTGYSSLSYLRCFPFDKIKIDKSFIGDLETSRDSQAIVQAVTGLALTLGMATTAEGVETEHQFDQLRLQGCTEIQGYLISRPIPAGDVTALLESAYVKPIFVEPEGQDQVLTGLHAA